MAYAQTAYVPSRSWWYALDAHVAACMEGRQPDLAAQVDVDTHMAALFVLTCRLR